MSDKQVTAKGLAKGLMILIQALREMNQRQRDRLFIMDSQLRVLSEFADRLDNLEARFENVLTKFQAVCEICARLNILCSNVGIKPGTTTDDGEEKDIEQELTHWN